MSDPVTNIEIEDVLSSIRRLVAEGDKAKQEKKKEYGSLSAETDKFVLTPALRISEDEPTESHALDQDDTLATAADPAPSDENDYAEQSASLKQAFVGDTQIETDTAPIEDLNDEAVAAADLPVEEAEPEADLETSRASLEATIAALEAAVTTSEDTFEPDGSEMEAVASWGTEDEIAFDSKRNDKAEEAALDTLQLTPADSVPSMAVVDTDDTADDKEQADTEAPDTAPEPSAATGRIFRVVPDHQQPEPEETAARVEPSAPLESDAMYSRSEAVVEEDHGDDLMDDDFEHRDLVGEDDDIDGLLATGATLDEDLIRRVVAEVVKCELEGKLGETITRNVRRLVRREINRVLTHQELE